MAAELFQPHANAILCEYLPAIRRPTLDQSYDFIGSYLKPCLLVPLPRGGVHIAESRDDIVHSPATKPTKEKRYFESVRFIANQNAACDELLQFLVGGADVADE
jgi:hypothetical protein